MVSIQIGDSHYPFEDFFFLVDKDGSKGIYCMVSHMNTPHLCSDEGKVQYGKSLRVIKIWLWTSRSL